MRAIRIQYAGNDRTRILWDQDTDGKLLMTQKYLMNVATDKDSDAIFEDRGTELLSAAIGGALLWGDVGNEDDFAAVNTLYFCNYEESAAVYNSDDNVVQFSITAAAYDNNTISLSMAADFEFADGTTYNTTLDLADNG